MKIVCKKPNDFYNVPTFYLPWFGSTNDLKYGTTISIFRSPNADSKTDC